MAEASFQVADQLKQVPQVSAATVNPDVVPGKPYVEFEVNRATAARYNTSTLMVNQLVETALRGINLTRTMEGRKRYPIRVGHQRDVREHFDQLGRRPVVTHAGEIVPLDLLAEMKTSWDRESSAAKTPGWSLTPRLLPRE